MKISGLCIVVAVSLVCQTVLFHPAQAEEHGINFGYQEWGKYRDILKKDPALFRYYTFEDVKDLKVKNLAGDMGDLVFYDKTKKPGESFSEKLKIVSGRWKQKKVVSINECSFMDADYVQPDGPFTFECWIRVHGYGKTDLMNGMVVAISNGYYNGWRIMIQGDSKSIIFQIGDKEPAGGTSLRGGNISTDAWQYIVAVSDDKTISLYLNGVFVGTCWCGSKNDGAKKLIIGYAAHGVGALHMDVGEVAVYTRALSSEEITRHFNLQP